MTELLAQIARPGDRWALPAGPDRSDGATLPLLPSWDLLLDAGEPVTVEGPDGRRVVARYDAGSHRLGGDGLAALAAAGTPDRWLLELVAAAPAAPFRAFEIGRQAAEFATSYGFERLVSLPLLRNVEPYEHQLRTVRTVLRRLRGRALLCDEVGLGKTIEARMILLELLVRKLVRRVLVLVPPSLVEQWQAEMRGKFGVELTPHDDPAFKGQGAGAWRAVDRIVASYHTAKREPHRSAILAEEWDLVVVDEAHHLRNRGTHLFRFAAGLRKKFILLLTATPLQNDLEDLYNLVTLLNPGLLGTARSFGRDFVDQRDALAPKNLGRLHDALAEVMVRNRRAIAAVRFTRRLARTVRVAPLPAERDLYAEVARFVRTGLRAAPDRPLTRMGLLTLKKAMGSSSRAAAATLARLAEGERVAAAERAALERLAASARRQTDSAKVGALRQVLRDVPDKVVLFTQFRATQEVLREALDAMRVEVALFHGGLTRLEKEAAVRAFEAGTRVLLSTDSGSEGRNLQFCHVLVNFDLPWNPMRIEQRIGRLSRIGQSHDVHVYNLVAAGTFEDDLLHLLEAKINLFELVLGETDMILGNLAGEGEERDFEELVVDLWVESDDEAGFRARLAELGDRLAAAKAAYLRQRELDDRLFGDRFVPEG